VQVEPDLDPFKFDVACMGNMLSDYDVGLFLITQSRDSDVHK